MNFGPCSKKYWSAMVYNINQYYPKTIYQAKSPTIQILELNTLGPSTYEKWKKVPKSFLGNKDKFGIVLSELITLQEKNDEGLFATCLEQLEELEKSEDYFETSLYLQATIYFSLALKVKDLKHQRKILKIGLSLLKEIEQTEDHDLREIIHAQLLLFEVALGNWDSVNLSLQNIISTLKNNLPFKVIKERIDLYFLNSPLID